MYAMYNDQPPTGHTSLNHGHTKGKAIEVVPHSLVGRDRGVLSWHNYSASLIFANQETDSLSFSFDENERIGGLGRENEQVSTDLCLM